MMSDKMTISNILSIFRGVLAVPLAFCLWYDYIAWVVVISLIAIFSDYLDGYFARRLNQISELGKILDPVADKIFVGTMVIIAAIKGLAPAWIAIVIVGRDVFILLGSLIFRKKISAVPVSNTIGKIAIFIISLALFLMIIKWEPAYTYGSWAVLAAVVVSLFVYIYRGIREFTPQK